MMMLFQYFSLHFIHIFLCIATTIGMIIDVFSVLDKQQILRLILVFIYKSFVIYM